MHASESATPGRVRRNCAGMARVVRVPSWLDAAVRFPAGGALRVHRAPTQMRPREASVARDRFDDPDGDYRVRYFATTLVGALLEVLDHFRSNKVAESDLALIGRLPGIIDILEEEP